MNHPHVSPVPVSKDLDDYLENTEIIDWENPAVKRAGLEISAGCHTEVTRAKVLFEWVRDQVRHSKDAGHEIVTCRATDVLEHRTGICYAKSHLLAALMRSIGIPCGFCYQLLRHDPPLEGMVVHALNAIYLREVERWVRVDARGNKPGVDAQFCLESERLAFAMKSDAGESIHEAVFVRPLSQVVDCLMNHQRVSEMWPRLPSALDSESGPGGGFASECGQRSWYNDSDDSQN